MLFYTTLNLKIFPSPYIWNEIEDIWSCLPTDQKPTFCLFITGCTVFWKLLHKFSLVLVFFVPSIYTDINPLSPLIKYLSYIRHNVDVYFKDLNVESQSSIHNVSITSKKAKQFYASLTFIKYRLKIIPELAIFLYFIFVIRVINISL